MLWRYSQRYDVQLSDSDPADFRRRFIECLAQGLKDRRAGEIKAERYSLLFSGMFLRPFILAGSSLNWIDDGHVQVYTQEAGASITCSVVARKLHIYCMLIFGLILAGNVAAIAFGRADTSDLFVVLVLYLFFSIVLTGYTRLRWFLLVRSCIKDAQA